jgi:hypothetical protein
LVGCGREKSSLAVVADPASFCGSCPLSLNSGCFSKIPGEFPDSRLVPAVFFSNSLPQFPEIHAVSCGFTRIQRAVPTANLGKILQLLGNFGEKSPRRVTFRQMSPNVAGLENFVELFATFHKMRVPWFKMLA